MFAARQRTTPGGVPAPNILLILFCLVLVLPAIAPAMELQPIPDADLSGLEPLGRDAILEARRQLTQKQDATAAGQAEAYARLAALYQRFSITGAADLAWANARALQPRDYRWPYYQGWLALETGRIERALLAFGEARRLKPDYAPLDLRMGQAWLAASRLKQAQEALRRAAEHTGLRAAALYYLGQIAVLQRDYARAEHLLGEALDLAPHATGIHYPLAQAYRGLGRRDEARDHLSRFKPGEPPADDPLVEQLQQVITRADEFFNAAMRAVKGRDYLEAIRQFEQGLAIDPDNDNARISYGRALYLAGRGKQAGEQFRRVLEQDPKQALAAFMLALLLDESGQHEQAVKRYQQVLSTQATHPGAHYFLANRLFLDGRYREAADHYQAAVAGDVDLPPARLLRLIALHHAGAGDRSLATELQALVDSHPDQVEYQYALVRLLALSKDPGVYDDIAAIGLANRLAQAQATPARLQALALAAAANGQFPVAVGIVEQAIAIPDWGMAPTTPGLTRDLSAYRRGVIPEQDIWPLDDPLLSPPPLDPTLPFREYLSATPF